MKIYKLLVVIFLMSGIYGNSVEAQQVEFELRYNDAAALYEVFAIPDSSNALYFVGGGSQLSILLPQDIENVPLEINTVAGGLWTDNSRIFAPESDHIHDFHGIASNGAIVNFVEGEPMLMFTFELPGGVCRSDVRLFENTGDRNSRAAGMNGSDFRNFFANVFNPLTNNWVKNKNMLNETCAHAPSVAPNSLTTQENISATICMPINDPNVGDLFEASLCANVAQSVNSFSTVSVSGNEICLEYNPSEGFVGEESVCIEVCDDTGLCNSSMVAIIVTSEPGYVDLSAYADQCQNLVDWTVFSPSDFEYFELERSEDGLTYQSLELFDSNDQAEEMEINYIDDQIQLDYFYRLKLVRTDGQIDHSEALFVNTSCDEDGELITAHTSVTAVADFCKNNINWTISNPGVCSYYELQRSLDGKEFESLDVYQTSSNMATIGFHFTDEDTKGDHYYRLKLMYIDGREEYSEKVFVESGCDVDDGFHIYPNPVSHSDPVLNLKFMSETESVNIIVTDPLGRILRRLNLDVELGMNILRLDVVDLSVGTYFIAIEGKEEITKSFVKIDKRF